MSIQFVQCQISQLPPVNVNVQQVLPIPGPQGEQGLQGISIVSASLNEEGHLILTLSNGNTLDAGNLESMIAWGDITGTLSNQSDLQAALNAIITSIPSLSGYLNTTNFTAGTNYQTPLIAGTDYATPTALTNGLAAKQNSLGYIPVANTVTINGHALSSNVTITASDLSLATVATSGSYTDLSNKPTIPTNTNQLTNGTGFLTSINSSEVTTALGFTPENTANKGISYGYCPLDVNGIIPMSYFPSGLAGALQYEGVWNANTNTPALTSGVGTKGFFYKISVSGNTTIDSNNNWHIGDWIVFDGTTWDKIDNYEAVTSVNGQTGAVSLSIPSIAGLITLSNLSASGGIAYNSSSGAFSVATGYYMPSTTDESNWNNKQSALGFTPVNKSGDTLTGNFIFNNAVGVQSLDTAGSVHNLAHLDAAGNAQMGSMNSPFILRSSVNPSYYDGSNYYDVYNAKDFVADVNYQRPLIATSGISIIGGTGSDTISADSTHYIPTTTDQSNWNAKQNPLTAGTDYATPDDAAISLFLSSL